MKPYRLIRFTSARALILHAFRVLAVGVGFCLVHPGNPLHARGVMPPVFLDAGHSESIVLDELVTIETNMGEFTLALDVGSLPETVQRFLDTATDRPYDNILIHRAEPDHAIYGGAFMIQPNGEPISIDSSPPPQETDQTKANQRGTIAMVTAGEVNSHWRINVADNVGDWDHLYTRATVFGNVVGDGMSTLDAIHSLPRHDGSPPFDFLPMLEELGPDEDFSTDSFVRTESATHLDRVQIVEQTSPDIVQASLENGQLRLASAPEARGSSEIALRFSGDGKDFLEVFEVTVAEFDFFGLPPGEEADESFWLGAYTDSHFDYAASRGWIRHAEHDWLYAESGGYRNGFWLWDEIQGDWIWTRKELYPFVYSNTQGWLYYHRGGTPEKRFFYNYNEMEWMPVEP